MPIIFDASTSYINIGAQASLAGVSRLSVGIDFKPRIDANNWRNIVGHYDGSSGWLITGHNGANTRILVLVGTGVDQAGISYHPTAGEWHRVFMVYDGNLSGNANRLKMYIDGELQTLTFHGSASIPATCPDATAVDARIGSLSAALPRLYDGDLDELDIYAERALTPDDIAADWFAHKKNYSIENNAEGLVSSYSLDGPHGYGANNDIIRNKTGMEYDGVAIAGIYTPREFKEYEMDYPLSDSPFGIPPIHKIIADTVRLVESKLKETGSLNIISETLNIVADKVKLTGPVKTIAETFNMVVSALKFTGPKKSKSSTWNLNEVMTSFTGPWKSQNSTLNLIETIYDSIGPWKIQNTTLQIIETVRDSIGERKIQNAVVNFVRVLVSTVGIHRVQSSALNIAETVRDLTGPVKWISAVVNFVTTNTYYTGFIKLGIDVLNWVDRNVFYYGPRKFAPPSVLSIIETKIRYLSSIKIFNETVNLLETAFNPAGWRKTSNETIQWIESHVKIIGYFIDTFNAIILSLKESKVIESLQESKIIKSLQEVKIIEWIR